jgi:phage gp16-like protein
MRKIYALSRERGIDGETLHSLVYGLTQKESVKKLTITEAVKVIDSLDSKAQTTPGMMTEKQRKYICTLLVKLGWVDDNGKPDTKRLMEFIRSQYKVERYEWISSSVAAKIIEAFKVMSSRAKQPV